MERAREKLDAFEEMLDDAYAYHEKPQRKKKRTCSSKKRIARLQSACEVLHEKYEDEFESESSDDEEEEWIYPLGVPLIEVKGVNMGVSQRSHQNPIETPTPTSGINPNEVIVASHNLIDALDVYKINAFTSERQESEFSARKTNQAEIQEGGFEYLDIQKSILFASFLNVAMQDKMRKLHEAEFVDFKANYFKMKIRHLCLNAQKSNPMW